MKPSKKYWSIAIGLVLLLAGSLILYVIFRNWKKMQEQELEETPDNDIINNTDDGITNNLIVDNYRIVKQACESMGVENENFQKLLTAQAMFESANFESDLFKANNNMFGMRQPQVRDTTSVGEKGGYASYASVFDSVSDRILWNRYSKQPETIDDLSNASIKAWTGGLKKLGYYEDSAITYGNGVYQRLSQLNNLISAG